MNANNHLPYEMLRQIACALLPGPCKIRRHIAIRLQQHQRLTTTKVILPPGIDLNFQQLARALMDYTEWNQFNEWLQASIGMTLANKQFFEASRDVERDWLQKMPMDYRQFTDFCNNPNGPEYEGRTELVLELFPTADFCSPPREMSYAGHVSQPLTTGDRILLALRGQWASSGILTVATQPLDLRVYKGLAELWVHFIQSLGQNPGQNPRLPQFVRRIWIISKDNDKHSSSCGPHELNGGTLGDITRELKKHIGTSNVNIVF